MYKKLIVSLIFGAIFIVKSGANVIDVFSVGDGMFQIVSDGEIVGTLPKAGADKIINRYRLAGNTINSTTANPKLGSFGTPPSTATGSGGSGFGGGGGAGTTTAAGNTKALVPQPKTSTSVVKYDPAVANSGASTAANTAQKAIGPAGNPGGTAAPKQLGSGTPSGTTAPKQLGPGTPSETGGGAGGGSGTGGGAGTAAKTAGTAAKAVGTGLAVIGGVVSAVDFADNAKAKERKTTWADVGRSAADGAGMAMGVAAVVNVIPVGGQIAYGAAIAVGAAAGAIHTARKIFSETDCDYDPVFGGYNCCNISRAMSNIDGRNVDIGGEMFCEFPYARKCVQGRKEYETDQGARGLFLNDHWQKNCYVKYCPGFDAPEDAGNAYEIIPTGQYFEDGSICWYWICPEGMTRDGAKCVPDGGTQDENQTPLPGDAPINAKSCNTDADCVGTKLPQYATAGRCIQKNKNERVCAATACREGTYLVKKNGRSMGWCRAGQDPDSDAVQPITEPVHDEEAPVVVPDSQVEIVCGDPDNMDSGCRCTVVPETHEESGKCVCNDSNKEIKSKKCEYTEAYLDSQRAKISAEIASISGSLTATINSLERSVWKDSEGNFNTARLASDSIAGVVLGTAGGIITSKLVKKNQLKKGFEDIQCYIGGQVVADYGDDFVVGN